MLNSSSLDTDDRWAWKRPCSFICWRWLPQVFASAFVIASFQSSNLKKEKIERHWFIHAITAHLFLTSKFKSMVKKKEKKLKVTSTGTAAASRLRLLIWMVTPSNIYQRPQLFKRWIALSNFWTTGSRITWQVSTKKRGTAKVVCLKCCLWCRANHNQLQKCSRHCNTLT